MSVILQVEHTTVYRYARPVAFGEHRIMFRPRSGYDVQVLDLSLEVSPEADVRWVQDVFSNAVTLVTPRSTSDHLQLVAKFRIEHFGASGIESPLAPHAEIYPFAYSGEERIDLGGFLVPQHGDPDGRVTAWANMFIPSIGDISTRRMLTDITETIRARLRVRVARYRRHADADADGGPSRRLVPRLRAADDRGGATPRLRRALRVGLHLRPGRRWPRIGRRRRRRDARVGRGLRAGRGMADVRSDQSSLWRARPDPRRGHARRVPGRAGAGLVHRTSSATSSAWTSTCASIACPSRSCRPSRGRSSPAPDDASSVRSAR